MRACAVLLACGLAAFGCNNQGSSGSGGGATTASASATAAVSAPAASSSAPAVASPVTWSGPYTATAGDLFYPRNAPNAKDWADLKWNGSDAATGLGDGTLKLTIDPKTKLVSGTTDGALGETIVNGAVDGDKLTAKLARKNVDDRGLTGTIVADVKADAIVGEMKLSSPDAQVIRAAKFTLSKQAP